MSKPQEQPFDFASRAARKGKAAAPKASLPVYPDVFVKEVRKAGVIVDYEVYPVIRFSPGGRAKDYQLGAAKLGVLQTHGDAIVIFQEATGLAVEGSITPVRTQYVLAHMKAAGQAYPKAEELAEEKRKELAVKLAATRQARAALDAKAIAAAKAEVEEEMQQREEV